MKRERGGEKRQNRERTTNTCSVIFYKMVTLSSASIHFCQPVESPARLPLGNDAVSARGRQGKTAAKGGARHT